MTHTMMNRACALASAMLFCCAVQTVAQPMPKADATIVFRTDGQGVRFAPTWGLDQAWISEQNLRKGINHIGAENIGVGRSAFRTTTALTNDSVLSSDQTQYLRQRANIFNIVSPTLPLILTADQEAGSDSYFVVNRSANVPHWTANINSHVHWLQQNTKHPVIAVSPFNEPDYWTREEGATTDNQAEVARRLKEQYPRFDTIAIVGGNTLNNDKAWSWFQPGTDCYEWGNTHQLAGSMDSYASFHKRLAELGKVGYNDEMHNVAEAMIGLEYGMTVGIWWGFDSRARGEFCDISRHGERLAYGEHRANWTAASVWRHDDGRLKAFIGSSERQAYTTTWQLVSADRDVYFDGEGPLRAWCIEMPGGTAYQTGQTNAERVVDITWGPDVQPMPITEGVYKMVNKATGTVLANAGTTIAMQKWSGQTRQKWTVKPCSPRVGGDYSFYDIESEVNHRVRINVLNFSTASGADLIPYEQASPTSNEQWYLQYAGDGYFYVRNRESALCLTTASKAPVSGVRVMQSSMLDDSEADRQLWRLLPADVDYETTPPATPSGLVCQSQAASIVLSWQPVADKDVDGYMVLRTESGSDAWNTIARRVKDCRYVDNTVAPATSYIYKVKAIDRAQNTSEPSAEAQAAATGRSSMVARYTMEGQTTDATVNAMDGAFYGTPEFVADCREGSSALRFLSTMQQYVQLPCQIASTDELSVALWVNLRSAAAWQRLFDFGTDTDHYLFLTPTNGSKMRFGIKNGGDEQTLDAPSLPLDMSWHHVALTLGKGHAAIYVDGEKVAETSSITISPKDVAPVLNYLGRSQFPADPFFTGYMDDVRIYNHVIGAAEISNAMQGVVDGIGDVQLRRPAQQRSYDLGGRQLKPGARGLQVVDGKVKIER